ncbi:unnamed protein product [Larinioides sclopetarius]|uniref:Anamorsin N-terminal domain-containing protein n=1 Tax=Larinioides sclopetarius TaxID=280406 RepID=A0AAV2BWA3_9ARAC
MNSCEQNPKKILLLWGPHVRQEHLIETVENLKKSEGDKTIVVVENFEQFVVAGHASSSFDTVLTSTLTSHPVEVFGEIARVLKLGRTAVIRESVTIEDNVPNLRTPPKLKSSLILSGFVNVGMPRALPKTKSNVEDYKKYFAIDEKSILFVEIEASKPNFEVGASIPLSSIKKWNEKMILLTEDERLLQLIENIRKAENEFFRLQTRLKPPMNNEKTKEELDQLSNKKEKVRNAMNQYKKFLKETGRLPKASDSLSNLKNFSEFAKSVRESDSIEERRQKTRREVGIQRLYNQLRAADLNRGLFVDQTFDLTSLDKTLPSVSHCKRAPGMKRRTLKLQDMVMNNVKERRLIRLATAGLCSMDTTSPEQNS